MNISSQTSFNTRDLNELYHHADRVIGKYYPDAASIFQDLEWVLPIDRVYTIEKAKKLLGYSPSYNFMEFLTKHKEDRLPCGKL